MYLFTSEVVSPGHPDKCADIIADSIVDRLIIGDPKSRVASEVFVHPDDVEVQVLLNRQSPDINQGVDQSDGETGAGDQGIMFGYADCETANFMPSAITYARMLMEKVYL